jgi:D-aspartate ligase
LNKTAEVDFGEDRPGAIVLGGNFVGLGIVRSLGARGIPTWVFDTDRSKSIAQFSRFTKRFVESKEPVSDLLIAEAQKHKLDGWVIFPVNDEYVEAIATHHKTLSSIYRLTTPPLEITRFALDKRLTYSKADELGIATPRTSNGNSLNALGAKGIVYPVILKPAINHHFFPQTNLKVLPAANEQDLLRGLAQMGRYIPSEEILVQERIPGSGESQFSFCAACRDGRIYASLVARRRRQYPVDFGNASSFVETADEPEVESGGRRFLESIKYDGIAEVEFKFDSRDGKFKILDANFRAWGWHTLGKAAGIDFAYLLWRQKVGLPVAPVDTHGKAAWAREITDFIAIAKSRDRFAEIKSLLRAVRRSKFTLAAFSFADPIPFFAEFVLWGSSGFLRKKKAKDFLKLSAPDVKR